MGPLEEQQESIVEAESVTALLEEFSRRPVGDRRLARWSARATEWAYRATTWGPFAPAAEAGWRAFRRDTAIAGSMLGAAVAYRIFVWLLPLALVTVATVGLVADTSSFTEQEVVEAAGIGGYFAASVADAAGTTSLWASLSLIVVGGFFTLYESFVLLRSFRSMTALAWALPLRLPKRPLQATLLFLALTFGCLLAILAVGPIRAHVGPPIDWLSFVGSLLVMPLYWLAVSWWLLPHRGNLRALIVGSVFFGVCMSALQVFNALILFPWIARKEETYGVLGVAAGLLFSFFVIGRIVVLSAALNATLAERRAETAAAGTAAEGPAS